MVPIKDKQITSAEKAEFIIIDTPKSDHYSYFQTCPSQD